VSVIRGLRSFLSVLAVGVLFVLGSLVLRLGVLPRYWLRPERRFVLVSAYMKWMARSILRLLTLGGARFLRSGHLPTTEPVVIVANHQSLIDILQVTLLGEPFVPAFVTRSLYGRFVPLVSASMRLLGCPLVDPTRDPRRSLEAIRVAARTLPHGILIFPEGHRSPEGRILPFRRAGLEALLAERRVPVYLAVSDGLWKAGRLGDMLFRVHRIEGLTEVFGPFESPADPANIPAFIKEIRRRMIERLDGMRAKHSEGRSPAGQPAPVAGADSLR
jgi:1-acyl-sn-glycerol-3-phosphate acyltransferase